MEHGHDLRDWKCSLDWWHGTKLFQRNDVGWRGELGMPDWSNLKNGTTDTSLDKWGNLAVKKKQQQKKTQTNG